MNKNIKAFLKYVPQALRTESVGFTMNRLIHAQFGLTTELAEIVEALTLEPGVFIVDQVNLVEECGDALWYLAIVCDELKMTHLEFRNRNSLLPEDSIHRPRSVSQLVISLGRFTDVIKRMYAYGNPVTPEGIWLLRDEASIMFWGIVEILSLETHCDLTSCLSTNIAKLSARFPEKFSNDNALNRNLSKERSVLEESST